MNKISVVVPVYGAPESVSELCRRIHHSLNDFTGGEYEMILVDDGCPLGSWTEIVKNSNEYPNLVGIKLSRNFGQHYAMSAGVDSSNGETVVFLDCDLQDRPEDIVTLYEARKKDGVEIVFAKSEARGKKTFLRQFTSKLYYRIHDYLSYSAKRSFNTSFMLMSRNVAEAFISMRESQRQFFSLINYLGFSSSTVEVHHDDRYKGESSYTFLSRLNMAINGITSNSTRLLKVGIGFGALVSSLSFLYGSFLIIQKLIYEGAFIPGWTAIMVAVFFTTGIIVLFLGIIGIYLETIFWEVKNRPYYFIEQRIGKDS